MSTSEKLTLAIIAVLVLIWLTERERENGTR